MPSASPAPDTEMATFGSDSLLPASLRISALMNRSIGPPGSGPPLAPSAAVPAATRTDPGGPADPGGSAGGMDTCVTWAKPPLAICAVRAGADMAAPDGHGPGGMPAPLSVTGPCVHVFPQRRAIFERFTPDSPESYAHRYAY